MDYHLVKAMAVGMLVFGALYLALDVVFPSRYEGTRKAKALFAGAGFLLVSVSLWKDPRALEDISRRLTLEMLAVVFVVLALLRLALRRP